MSPGTEWKGILALAPPMNPSPGQNLLDSPRSIFVCELPASGTTVPMLDFITQHDLPTILLIDDDMVSREVMATLLTMSGIRFTPPPTAPNSLTLIAAKSCVPDIILMDVQMPGLSGIEFDRASFAPTATPAFTSSAPAILRRKSSPPLTVSCRNHSPRKPSPG